MTQTLNPILQVKNLRSAFQTDRGTNIAVDGVSFDLYPQECLGIVGESGCGKSVTAMSILKLLPQPSGKIIGGEVIFEGVDLIPQKPSYLRRIRGKKIAMIFQDPMQALNPVESIGSQITEALQLHQGLRGQAARNAAIELLRRVHIPAPEKRIDHYPHQLSGGMRQRVLIAQAIAGEPRIIIADEPTTALDVTIEKQILDLLHEQHACATILITHDLALVAQHCQRVVVMYAGRVVEIASVEDLFDHPAHAYTKALLNSLPRAHTQHKTHLPTIPGQVAALDELVSGCRYCQRMGRTGNYPTGQHHLIEISKGHLVDQCPHCLA